VSSLRRFIAVYALLAGALALYAWYYFPYLSDAALVSLRYSMRLVSGGGLIWTDGERIEGYDNFLWIVLNAAGGAIAGFIPSARAIGFAGVLLVLWSVGLEPRGPGVSLPRLVVGGVLAIATAPIVIASVDGLEHGLVAGLLALSLRLLERSASSPSPPPPWAPGIVLALLVLLRTDGVFLVAALLAGSACLPRPSLGSVRRIATTALPPVAALFAQLAFRLSYYGKWLPSSAPAPDGAAYVAGGLASAAMLLLLSVGATVLAIRRGERASLVMPWAVVASTTATIVVAGGDASAGFGPLVPTLVALCFIAADEVAADWSRILSQRMLVLPMLALCAFLHATQSAETAENRRAKTDTRTTSDLEVGRALATAFGAKRPLLAVDRPGAMPFGSELPSLDFSGWQTPAPNVAARRPDLVVFGEPSKPEHAASIALLRSKDFGEIHEPITVQAPDGAERQIWIRREGGKVGIARKADRIDVPGYLFGGDDSTTWASLDQTGRLVAGLTRRRIGVLAELALPPGRWRVEAPAPELAFDVRCDDLSMQPHGSSAAENVFVATTKPVTIVVAANLRARRFDLPNVTLTRITDTRPASTCAHPGLPLRIPEARLLREQLERAHWTHPSHVLFRGAGLVIEIGPRGEIRRIELSLTANEGYSIELRRGGEVVWTKLVESRGRGHSLLNNVFDLPKPVEGGRLELVIKPQRSDSLCGIGHVSLR
jgi:hypothetical protein